MHSFLGQIFLATMKNMILHKNLKIQVLLSRFSFRMKDTKKEDLFFQLFISTKIRGNIFYHKKKISSHDHTTTK